MPGVKNRKRARSKYGVRKEGLIKSLLNKK